MRRRSLVKPIVAFIAIVLSFSLSAQEQAYTAAENLTSPKMVLLHGKIVTPILTSSKNIVPEHLKEFGLYRTGLYADNEDIAAVAPFATFIDVKYNNTEQMRMAKSRGLKLWVDMRLVFFTKEKDGYIKRSDYKESWENVKEILLPFKNVIYAFDPLDEPFFNTQDTMSVEAVQGYLEEIASLLEADFPNARRALTFTKGTVENFQLGFIQSRGTYPFPLPQNWNLLGVDNYVGNNFAGGVVQNLMDVTENFGDHHYYLIPQAFQSDDDNYAFLSSEQLITKARQAYNFAVSHPRVEVLRPYHWDSYEDSGHLFVGVEDLPELRNEYEKIGSAISNFR